MAIQNIALLAQTPEFDPLVPAQRQAQIQALADQSQQRQLAIQQARQNADEYAGVRSVYAANPTDAAARLSGLAAVSPRAYAAEQKQQTETAKAAAETRVKQIQAAKERLGVMGQGAKYVADNPTLENATRLIQNWQNDGLLTSDQAAGYLQQVQNKPESIRELAMEAYQSSIDAEKQLPKIETLNIGGQEVTRRINPITGQIETVGTIQRTQSPESVASVGATIRGQNMTAATAAADRASREKISASSLEAKGEKPMTEFQGKSAGFADRAAEADKILGGLNYSPAALNSKASAENTPLIGGLLGSAANALTSSENQQAEQAQRNFVNAVLRQESGAAIGQSEFDNARRQYFPQPGDSKAVIDQKAANRKTAIAGLQRSAGPSYKAPAAGAPRNVPNTNAKGWTLHTDAQGNRAYVSPDGSQFEEVQ